MKKIINGVSFYNFQSGAVNGAQLPGYLVKWGTKLFGFFAERKHMEKWFETTMKYCSENQKPFPPLEVIYQSQRCGFFADIEGYISNDSCVDEESLKRDIISHVCEAYNARGLDPSQLKWVENHRIDLEKRRTKISFHVIGRDVDFVGCGKDSHLARVAKKMNHSVRSFITEKYPDVEFSRCGKTGKPINVFDLSVYSENRAMRTVYSSKEGSFDSRFVPCEGFEHDDLSSFWIVRDIDDVSRRVHCEPWTREDEEALKNTGGPGKSFLPGIRQFRASDHISRKANGDSQQLEVEKKLQTYFRDVQGDPTIQVRFHGKSVRDGLPDTDTYRIDGNERNCAPCRRVHHSNGGFIFHIEGNEFRYICPGNNWKATPVFVEIGTSDPVPPPDHMELDESDNGMVPSILDIEEKCIVINAGMGTGKTYRVKEYISQNPDASVLYLTCRVSMASEIQRQLSGLGFSSYRDPDIDFEREKRLICEYESICRLRRKYDIVVMDEARAILNATTVYETNKDRLLFNYRMLKLVAQSCDKFLVMCADCNLDSALNIFIEDVYGEKPPVRYLKILKPKLQRNFILTGWKESKEQMAQDIFHHRRKIIGCFGSAREMKATAQDVEKYDKQLKEQNSDHVPIRLRIYYSKCPHKNELKNIDIYWDQFDVIFYTSTITVALDYLGDVFRIYSFPDRMSCGPIESLQGFGRARNVVTGEVIVATPPPKADEDQDVDKVFFPLDKAYSMTLQRKIQEERICSRRENTGSLMMTMLNTLCPTIGDDGVFKHLPSPLTKIWACNIVVEKLKLQWYEYFLWILEKKGYSYEHHTPESESESDDNGCFPETKASELLTDAFKTSRKNITEQYEQKILDSDIKEMDEECRKKIELKIINGNATEKDVVALDKYNLQRNFSDTLSKHELLTVLRDKRSIVNISSLLKLTPHERDEFFAIRTAKRSETDFMNKDHLILKRLDEILRFVGFEGINDRSTLIDKEQINQNKKVSDALGDIRGMKTGVRLAPSKKRKVSHDGQILVEDEAISHKTEISTLLRNLIGLRFKQKRKQVNKVQYSYYLIEEISEVWQVARKDNKYFTDSWKKHHREYSGVRAGDIVAKVVKRTRAELEADVRQW